MTSLNVGSLNSSFLWTFFNTDAIVGMSLRSVFRSIFETFLFPPLLPGPPAAVADSSPFEDDDPKPKPNAFLNTFPTGLFNAYSSNKSIFSAMNKSPCVLVVTPLLNSKTRSENVGSPTFSSGFFFKNSFNKLTSYPPFAQSIVMGKRNMKSSSMAKSHSVALNNVYSAVAIIWQNCVTNCTLNRSCSVGLFASLFKDSFLRFGIKPALASNPLRKASLFVWCSWWTIPRIKETKSENFFFSADIDDDVKDDKNASSHNCLHESMLIETCLVFSTSTVNCVDFEAMFLRAF